MKIVNVPYGLASRYDNIIEINKKLKNPLRKKILLHEKSHSKGKYTLHDLKVDFSSKKPYFFESLLFSLKNPEAIIGWFPIMFSYYLKIWTFNTTFVFIFIFYSLIFALLTSILLKVSILLGILAFFNFIIVFNIFLLIFTHIYVVFIKGYVKK